jgi:fibronectin-binding autotransporter adhesin
VFGQQVFFHLLGLQALPPFVWTGNGANSNWTTIENWSQNTVPGVGDTAIFGAYCTTNCNPTIAANISVKGFNIESGYTGTITQPASITFSIGTDGWVQAGGTFAGGNSNVTISGPFTFSGGTYTATSAETLLANGMNYTAGTFAHNNGTLRFDNNGVFTTSTFSITLPGVVTVYKLRYTGGRASNTDNYTYNITAGSFDVQNEFRIGKYTGTGAIRAAGGTIALKGNLLVDDYTTLAGSYTPTNLTFDGTGAQTYTATGAGLVPNLIINKASGTVTPVAGTTGLAAHSFTLTQGSFTGPAGTFRIGGAFNLPSGVTLTANSTSYDFSQFNMSGSQSYTITLDQALACVDASFGGGNSGSSTTTTWTLAGTSGVINATGNLNIRNTNGGTGAITVNGGALNVAGNATSGAYAGTTGTTPVTFNGTGAQSYTKSGSGGNHGGNWTVSKASGTLALATAVTLTGSGQDVTITTGTLNLAGFNLTVTDVLTIDTNGTLLCNGGTVTYASAVVLGNVSCGTSLGITWTGTSGDHLFSTAGNWSNNNIPGSGDVAIFTTSCTGANCDAQTTANTSLRGILMTSGYTGTLTQTTGHTLTIGTAGYLQAGGTYLGNASAFTITSANFLLSGGTFTSTSNVLTVSGGNFTISGAPTFNHNSGTLLMTKGTTGSYSLIPGSVQYYNVSITGYAVSYDLGGGTMTVNGTLSLGDTYSGSGQVNNGTFAAKGDVTFSNFGKHGSALLQLAGNADQTLTSVAGALIPNVEINSTGGTVFLSGTLMIYNANYTQTAGTVSAGTSTLLLESNTGLTRTLIPGNVDYNNVTFRGYALTTAITGTMKVYGTLTLSDTYASGGGGMSGGTVQAFGNIVTASYGKAGTTVVQVAGSTNQSITGIANAKFPNFEIASTGGIATFNGTLLFNNGFTYTSGVADFSGTTAIFAATQTLSPGTVNFNHVTFSGNNTSQTISGSINVLGTTTIADSSGTMGSLNTGTIMAYGDVSASSNGKGGSALVKVVGSGNQTVTGISAARIPPLEIASTGGNVTLSGTLRLGSNFTYTTGNLDPGTAMIMPTATSTLTLGPFSYYDLYFAGNNASISLNSGTVSVTNSVTLGDTSSSAGGLNSGTIELTGPTLTLASYGKPGSALIKVMGSGNQSIVGSGAQGNVPNLEIASTGGTVTLSGTIYPRANYTQTSGVVSAATSTLHFQSSSTIVPGSVIYNNVTIGGSNSTQSLSGGTMNVTGTLSLQDSTSSYGALNSGTILATGNFQTFNYGKGGNALIKIAGSTSQTISGTSTASVPSLEIASTGGTVSVYGSVFMRGAYTQTSGTISHGNSSLIFGAGATITPGTAIYNNVTFQGGGTTFNLSSGTMSIAGSLTITDSTSSMGSINSGTLKALGPVSFTGYGKVGTAILSIEGNNSTLSIAGGAGYRTMGTGIQVAKTAGQVLILNTNSVFTTPGQTLTMTSGGISMAGFNLTIPSTAALNGNTITKGGGTLTVNGSVIGTGSLLGGTVSP